MVLRLLSNVCVATPFYQLPAYHVYSFLRNLLYIIEKLAELFGFDFSDVLITDVQSRDDAEDKGTLLCVCIYDAREIQSVGYYFNERVSDVVDPELAKIPPGDIEELLDMGIKRANIEQYGFNFREIRVGYSDYPYLIYWFRIDNSYDGQSNFILLTWIPRKVSVRVERIVSDEFAGQYCRNC